MAFSDFFANNKWVLLFYLAVILLVYLNRRRFDMQGIIALYRTKVGLSLMDRIAKKYGEAVKIIGYIGIGISYIGLLFISYYLIHNLYKLFFVPNTPAGVSLIVPGIDIPGSPFSIPLVTGWIALFIIITVHEFSHGVVARAHGLKIKSSGILFLGPIMGAFVEPDEKEVAKASDPAQYSVSAAGPFSNILLAIALFFIGSLILIPAIGAMTTPAGFYVSSVTEGFPAEKAGLKANEEITAMDGIPINKSADFFAMMKDVKPNDTIDLIAAGRSINITATAHPDGLASGYIGVRGFTDKTELKKDNFLSKAGYAILRWLEELLRLTITFSLGIGLINLLPLGPVDGGRMMQLSLSRVVRDKKRAEKMWARISLFFLAVLVLNLIYPMFARIL